MGNSRQNQLFDIAENRMRKARLSPGGCEGNEARN